MTILIEGRVTRHEQYLAHLGIFPRARHHSLLFYIISILLIIIAYPVIFFILALIPIFPNWVYVAFLFLVCLHILVLLSPEKGFIIRKALFSGDVLQWWEIEDDGIYFKGSLFNTYLDWKSISKVVLKERYLFIINKQDRTFVIPLRLLSDPTKLQSIRALLLGKLEPETVEWGEFKI